MEEENTLACDVSFDENESIDLTSVIAEFPNGDDHPGERIPVKKLSTAFEGCIKPDDHMKVYLRVRPTKSKDDGTVIIKSDTEITTNAPESSKRAQYTKTDSRHYAFSRVFGPDSAQDAVYNHTTAPMARRFLDGENCVLFAYGMTNAGKTYTIQGTKEVPGILPRLVTAILYEMGTSSGWDLHLSMMEIYQENIYDLLVKKKKEKLFIRDAFGKVEVPKLTSHAIKSTKDACKLMDTAASNRSKASTFLNRGSSRSHAVYTVTLQRSVPSECSSSGSNREPTASEIAQHSVAFQLVDLAGAERSNRTKATSAQQKEANNINTSLMQLWRCLHGMKKNANLNSSQEMIPFRESKLTHLLMPILNRAGMAGVAMVACVNPQGDDYDETLSILGNASLASKITEIADVGRTLAQQKAEDGGAHQNKRRRVESTASVVSVTTTSTSASQNSGRHNYLAPTAASHAAANDKPVGRALSRHNSTKNTATTTNGNNSVNNAAVASTATVAGNAAGPRNANRGSSKEIHNSTVTAQDMVEAALIESERKKLRQELDQLRGQNADLLNQQVQRETEIRIEVSEEMAQRSSHLLDQIQDLQCQLAQHALPAQTHLDVTKSVKKQRKRQIAEIAKEDAENDLKEAEEEMARLKTRHESEIAHLRVENMKLCKAVRALQEEKKQYEWAKHSTAAAAAAVAAAEEAAKLESNSSSNTSSTAATIPTTAVVAGEEFSQRLKRDQRFSTKKVTNENSRTVYSVNIAGKNGDGKKSPMQRSPNRSPLSEMSKNNASNSPNGGRGLSPNNTGGKCVLNSPRAFKSVNNGGSAQHSSRSMIPVASPQRLRPTDENAAPSSNSALTGGVSRTYSTRLRSNAQRA